MPIPGTEWIYYGPHAPWYWIVKGPFIVLRALPLFVCGICIYRLWRFHQTDRLATPWLMAFATIAVLATMHFGLPRVAIIASLILLGIAALGERTINHRWLANPMLFWLGNVSLGLYLLHFPVLDGTEALFWLATGRPIEDSGAMASLLLLFGMMLFIVVLADICHRRFEKPARQ